MQKYYTFYLKYSEHISDYSSYITTMKCSVDGVITSM